MEAYKVGVSLVMTSNHTEVLSLLARDLLGVHVKVEELQKNFARLGMAIGGAFAIGAGVKLIETMGHMIEKGNELVKIQQDMAQAGMKASEIQEAYGQAWELTRKNTNMSAAEIMKLQSHGRTIFGDAHHAMEAMPAITGMGSFLRAYQGREKGAKTESALTSELEAAMKSGEIAGKITPDDMTHAIRSLTAMKVVYGDQVKISQYLNAQRRSSTSMRNVSDEFRYGIFPALVQENKEQAGVAFMTAWQKLVSGTGNTIPAVQQMLDLGLIIPGMEGRTPAKYDKQGNLKSGNKLTGEIKIGGIVEQRLFTEHPLEWIDKVLKPRLDEKTGGNNPILETQLISRMFPNRNAAFILTELLQQSSKFHKDAHLMAGAVDLQNKAGTDAYKDKSFDYQVQSFQTQWDNLIQALGAPAVATATEMLRKLNVVLADFVQYAAKKENAEFLNAISKGIVWLGAALVGGGAVAILAAIGPAGWIAVGITLLAGAVTLVDWKKEWDLFGQNLKDLFAYVEEWNAKWNALKDAIYKTLGGYRDAFFEKVTEIQAKWDEMKLGAVAWMSSLVTNAIDGITSIPDKVHDSIVAMGEQIVNYIKETFEGLLAKIPLISKSSFGGGGFGGGGGGIYNASLGGGGGPDLSGMPGGKFVRGVGGGPVAEGLKALGRDVAGMPGFGRISAMNDAFHKGTGSLHTQGLAMDFTTRGNHAAAADKVRAMIAGAGVPEGAYKVLDEYAHPSARSTGGHIHVEFANRQAAEMYRNRGRGNRLPPSHDEPVKIHTAVNLSGKKFADNTTQHQGRMANGPSHGGQAFDGTRQHAGPDSAHLAA